LIGVFIMPFITLINRVKHLVILMFFTYVIFCFALLAVIYCFC